MTGQNLLLEDGLYQLGNHPNGAEASPRYGLRLDGILTGNANDIVTFDFEHPDSDVKLELSGSQIRIFGVTFGGIDIGESYDPHNSGLWEIDFTYNQVQELNRGLIVDDDLIVDQANVGSNTGTIKQLFGEEKTFDLNDYAGNHPISFQLGNEINDRGHRGFAGLSGWGWLQHSNFEGYAQASDWLFTVNPEPLTIDKNNPPHAVDDFASTQEGHQVGIRMLENDSDPDGDMINLKSFTQASNGVVKRHNNGTIGDRSDDRLVYHPHEGFTGTDRFTYAIADGRGGMDTATVTVTVHPANNPPHAVDDFATTTEGHKVGIRVLENDSDPDGDVINLKSFTQASNGVVRRNNNWTVGDRSDDRLVYHPHEGFTGTDRFTYAIADGRGGMDTATVTVIVSPTEPTNPNDPTEPTNPNDPTEPTEPTEPTNPTEPTDPNNQGITYQLCNHPNGNAASPFYGLRLDGLLTGNADDIVTFDFENAQSDMRITIQDHQIRIFGVAYGGPDMGNEYDSQNSGLWKIDFTYNNVTGLDGDDDLIVDRSLAGTNRGSITQLYGKETSFDLTDYAGNHPITFQLGDEVDNLGHRGFTGISGWGWVNHSGSEEHLTSSDFLFTVKTEENISDRPFAVDIAF